MRKQVRHLVFERARVDDLTQRSVGRERQQVAGNIEGAGPQRALVGLLLHLVGLGRDAGQVQEHAVRQSFVFREQGIDRVG